jgi:glutamyl/glutaminyl-tRNA synthetase
VNNSQAAVTLLTSQTDKSLPTATYNDGVKPGHSTGYRGRLAPSPTGLLHLGHAATFWTACQRARHTNGTLILRNENLDPQRSKPQYIRAFIEDLNWIGITWQEGPDIGGPFAPYSQSERHSFYVDAWRRLRDSGYIYPCTCSRKDLSESASAPHDSDDEPIYSGRCRHRVSEAQQYQTPAGVNWRFRVPDGEPIAFTDLHVGEQSFIGGHDFGDFLIWRRDNVPAYQLAVVVDDAAMQISEVVRGADLLRSTARQILLARALDYVSPAWYHCDLLRDEHGQRLAKRTNALSLRYLREEGLTPDQVQARFLPRNG